MAVKKTLQNRIRGCIPAPSIAPTPSSTNAFPEFPSWAIPLLLSLIVTAAGFLVYFKKRKHNLVKKV
jgi:hypothetical protein